MTPGNRKPFNFSGFVAGAALFVVVYAFARDILSTPHRADPPMAIQDKVAPAVDPVPTSLPVSSGGKSKEQVQKEIKALKPGDPLYEMFHPKAITLSLAQQQAMFVEKAEGENENEAKCERKYPIKHIDEIGDQGTVRYLLDKHGKMSADLDDALYDRIEKKYHLSYDQMCTINGKGVQENWPHPPID